MSNEMQARQQLLRAAKTILDQAALLAIDAEAPICKDTIANRVQLILQVATELEDMPNIPDMGTNRSNNVPNYQNCLDAARDVVCRTCIFNAFGMCPHSTPTTHN